MQGSSSLSQAAGRPYNIESPTYLPRPSAGVSSQSAKPTLSLIDEPADRPDLLLGRLALFNFFDFFNFFNGSSLLTAKTSKY